MRATTTANALAACLVAAAASPALGAPAAASGSGYANSVSPLGVYAAGTVLNEKADDNTSERGTGYELGLTGTLGHFQATLFGKSMSYAKTTTGADGVASTFDFHDRIVGVGGRFIGNGFSLKFGRALHSVSSSDASVAGRDNGMYFGAGFYLGLPGGVAVFADFTRYLLQTSRWHADDVIFGAFAPITL